MDFADDVALISEDIDMANEFLLRVESAAASVGLHINEGRSPKLLRKHPFFQAN